MSKQVAAAIAALGWLAAMPRRLLSQEPDAPPDRLFGWEVPAWLSDGWDRLARTWATEVTRVDDKAITIGAIVLGVLLFFVGLYASRRLSRLIGRRLQRHSRINEAGAAAIQTLAYYVLLVLFTFTALRFVNVPLTAFAFLGGAIAIGVGFGSQNIINNFISGLILLAERPIRVNDLIQLEDLTGTVIAIGARSTKVRTATNMDIIVPNSSFLENNVMNFTLGDNKLRASVAVGIAYGSPTADARRLLLQAADEEQRALKLPEPFVLFQARGDNSLLFEVRFWVEVRTMTEMRQIESDMRFRIDELFRQAGIVIAFPQRDVHIDADSPLPVHVVQSDSTAS